MKRIKFLALFLVIFCTAISCTGSKQSNDGIIRMRLPGDPPTLDWAMATDNVSKEVINPIQEGLVIQGKGVEVQPAMAKSWEISKDGTLYTFTLRDNAVWSDGVPVVAQHFVDGWERLLNPKTGSEYAYFLFDVQGAEDYQSGKIQDFSKVGVKAVDDQTLQVKLSYPASYWIHVPTFWVTYPVRKDLIKKFGDKWASAENMVSNGPYSLKVWQRESRILLEKNPRYYDLESIKNSPEQIEFRTVKESSIAVTLFNNGKLDIVRDLPPIQLPTLSKKEEFVSSNQFRGYYVAFNIKDSKVKDPRIRKAIALAIDRTQMEKALHGAVSATKSWIPKGMLAYDESIGISFNPEEAKKLWSEIKNPPKAIEMWFDSGERNKIVGENIQSQVKKVLGIEIKIQVQEWKVYLRTLVNDPPTFWRLGWGADYPDPDNFMNLFTCSSGNNNTRFCSKSYDAAIKEAAGSQDEGKRVELYTKAQKQLLEEEVAIVPLFNEKNMHLVSQRVEGFYVNEMGDFSFKRITLK